MRRIWARIWTAVGEWTTVASSGSPLIGVSCRYEASTSDVVFLHQEGHRFAAIPGVAGLDQLLGQLDFRVALSCGEKPPGSRSLSWTPPRRWLDARRERGEGFRIGQLAQGAQEDFAIGPVFGRRPGVREWSAARLRRRGGRRAGGPRSAIQDRRRGPNSSGLSDPPSGSLIAAR